MRCVVSGIKDMMCGSKEGGIWGGDPGLCDPKIVVSCGGDLREHEGRLQPSPDVLPVEVAPPLHHQSASLACSAGRLAGTPCAFRHHEGPRGSERESCTVDL